MKKNFIYFLIFISPIITVISVNETCREFIYKKDFLCAKINPSANDLEECSWACHKNTNYCKLNHLKLSKKRFNNSDKIYFSIIKALKKSGNYQLANIIVLVIIIPLVIYILLVKSIIIQKKINRLKSSE